MNSVDEESSEESNHSEFVISKSKKDKANGENKSEQSKKKDGKLSSTLSDESISHISGTTSDRDEEDDDLLLDKEMKDKPVSIKSESSDEVNQQTKKVKYYRAGEGEYCQVCEQKLIPLKYNMIIASRRVCPGCREFFERSKISGDNYECTEGDNKCSLLESRTKCRKCRLDKCFQAGMVITTYKKKICSICADEGASIQTHYGIPACKRCFGFYSTHRSDSSKLVCKRKGRCQIKKGLFNKCSKCRFDKFTKEIEIKKANDGKI